MKITLKLEEAVMAAIAIYGLTLYNLGLPFWAWFILFFTPDIGMLGYLINTRIGALVYNLFHHKAIAIFILGCGLFYNNEIIIVTGILLFGHSSFDRIWGYGLKYNDSFKHTHLGML